MKKFTRRNFVKVVGGTAAVSAVGAPVFSIASGTKKVVVVGGGTAGATAAKYIKRGDSSIDVTIIEPNQHYHTCYLSNEVLSGHRTMESIRFGYDGLKGHGINVVHDMVSGIDAGAKKVMTAGGQSFDYDRCIVAPGVSLRYDTIGGYSEEAAQMMPHAWKAGEQTQILRDQIHAMKDGGTVIIAPPPNPFRCPPGPYERACQIGMYLKANKLKSKIIILDAKKKFSKMKLFTQAFDKYYKGVIEWHSVADTGGVASVDAKAGTVTTKNGDTLKGDVVNIIPAQHAGSIAKTAGLANDSGWCPVDHATFESTIHKGIHVIGDAAIQKPLPKSGYAANSEAKVTAAAVVNLLNGNAPGDPSWVNTCYSIVGPDDAISVAMVYNLVEGKVAKIKGSGGLTPMDSSASDRAREVQYAYSWFNNITSDIFM
ncbi:NAD(P)/FAD-dependent oxidoreductase [Solemya elarraichensis gill symbiont]|uniref:Cytochrome C n=1 Tax=Solemya elarraichensis gill symbiont TaxID=1918949 RepID=A0A1T2LCL8_9GAMM|nr:NAD(P)/FAD-dependent oxidoreductase [Solemya elarraichensis gill symbiont]OOZ42686.1 cytochrome C [Solemya elarraichensis gill symbiont]